MRDLDDDAATQADPALLARLANSSALQLSQIIGGCVVVALLPEDAPVGTAAMFGNNVAFSNMMRGMCDLVLKTPRPADCDRCGKAWDSIQQARLALTPIEGSCQ